MGHARKHRGSKSIGMYQEYREHRSKSKSSEDDDCQINDMPVTIYVDPLSQPSRALIMFCRMAKIDHVDHRLNLMAGEHKTEEYAKVNPKQQVPAIKEGDWDLSETTAIFRYIATTKKCDDHWYPKDAKKRARIDEYLSWQPTELRAADVGMFITAGFPSAMGKPVDEELMKEKRAKMDTVCGNFEKFFLLGDAPYIGGLDQISIADIWAACETLQAITVGFDISKFPKMQKWFESVNSQIPDWDELSQCVWDIGNKYTPPK